MERIPTERTRPAPHRAPRYLALEACLVIAGLAAAAGTGLRLLKPVDPPDPAFLERLAAWKALAPEAARTHHLQGPAPSP